MKLSELDEFDGAKHLKSDETICEYLNGVFAADDPRLFVAALRNVVRATGTPVVAERAGVELDMIEKALAGGDVPTLNVIVEFLRTLGLRIQVIPKRPE